MQFKPVMFVIIGLSLMSLAVTNGLQQQAMAKPKFDNSQLGQLCRQIYDAWMAAEEDAKGPYATQEDIDIAFDFMLLYAKHCGDKYGTKGLNPDLKEYLDKLLENSKVQREGFKDLLEKGMTNTTK